ncbi:uracil phosphoribosyltransferase [Bradymonadaceae bacterium TMQ3]|uniref:Uracil phosphoribosyltransferase n=1 Tax=Lujinxingia sediminis TaxID=2480984 RepID=A0ABY0CNS6_9DELT|nr:uracil phosphoribosyltransferase [Lujinxingia sediminis]RDV36382.1 uracil phosphoribosyltransferase [Bradymonadaceae bacterium TMQ3]RVU41481.1 uracil phosphoribosyltransferase [Lujinxingia sediminis]TXC68471.1 uracil phosphoribosyltransferase [Bradymonadales bacterium TMQ1]
MEDVTVIDHPLIQHKLSLMREKDTTTAAFRSLMGEVALLLGYEVTRDLPIEYAEIETPLTTMNAPHLVGKKLVIVPILRAGVGFVDPLLQLLPSARVGHIGLYRDPETLQPVEYYLKLPEQMDDRDVIVVDPMLATGHSAAAAVTRIKAFGPRSIKFMCLLAAPEGVEHMRSEHPDVPIYTAAIDEKLNEKGYIVPGLGDAGDRLYGTK